MKLGQKSVGGIVGDLEGKEANELDPTALETCMEFSNRKKECSPKNP